MENINTVKLHDLIENVSDIDIKKISSVINSGKEEKSVLGFDIYGYSSYESPKQELIPIVFKILLESTLVNCMDNESLFFEKIDISKYLENFIDTGDGGFFIFDNPLQSLIFSIYFQANIYRFNSSKNHENYRKIIGNIVIRYALSTGETYKIENNHYGKPIIMSARMMSKDKLNRFLMDSCTHDWLCYRFNSIENLKFLDGETISKILNIPKKNKKTLLFQNNKGEVIYNVNVQKIGELRAKNTDMDIFNIQLQVKMHSAIEGDNFKLFAITIGNLNTQGIN